MRRRRVSERRGARGQGRASPRSRATVVSSWSTVYRRPSARALAHCRGGEGGVEGGRRVSPLALAISRRRAKRNVERMSYATPTRKASYTPSIPPSEFSSPVLSPSFTRRVSTASSSAGVSHASPSAATADRKKRSRLRDYYGLAKAAPPAGAGQALDIGSCLRRAHRTRDIKMNADWPCSQTYQAHSTQTPTSTRSLRPLLCLTSCAARTNS